MEGVWERPPYLRQEPEFVDCEARFAAPRAGRRPGRADDVAEVDVDLSGAARVAEKLDPPGAVDEVEEDELPHLAASDHSAGDAAFLVRFVARLQLFRLDADGGDLAPGRETLGQAHRRASLTGLSR